MRTAGHKFFGVCAGGEVRAVRSHSILRKLAHAEIGHVERRRHFSEYPLSVARGEHACARREIDHN